MDIAELPHLNAALNSVSAVLLLSGFVAVRRGRVGLHKKLMAGAVAVSAAFLASYLVYHANVGSVKFTAEGWVRPVYFFVLITHIVLAAAIVPLVLKTLYHALRDQRDRHRRIARWTWPLWVYVGVSGVVVYVMAVHLFPQA